jgi:hypothetical protein
MDKEVDVNEVLKYLRETIGIQAQEIAVLKATLEAHTANS